MLRPALLGLLTIALVHPGMAYDEITQRHLDGSHQLDTHPGPVRPSLRSGLRLFGSEVERQNLIRIDPETVQVLVIGPISSGIIAGLAFDETQGVLYGTSTLTGDLVTIDPSSGATTVIGDTGLGLPHGCAIDPATGTLYVVDITSGSLISTLYEVDKQTASTTEIGTIGFDAIGALDFDPTTGILYGAHAHVTSAGFLVTIDTNSGAGTFVADTHRINGLSFDSSGQLYASENGNVAGTPSWLYLIDKNTGAWVEIGSLGTGNVLGLVFESVASTPVTESTWGRIKAGYR